MRAVRCDACGTKALTAASKCPACGHLFAVRDGFGDLLPLAYCPNCDSYYPESVGSCKWCGTMPERAPMAPKIWKGVGAAALVVLAAGAWLMRDSRPQHDTYRPAAARTPEVVLRPVDTAVAPVVAIGPGDTLVAPTIAVAASVEPVAPPPAPMQVAAKPVDLPPAKVSTKVSTTASTKASASAPSRSRVSSPWVNSISRSWVVVRSDADKRARIVASIGPSSRVQLGETRGSWQRIKAKGIAGWVEPRALFIAVRPSGRANGLAAR